MKQMQIETGLLIITAIFGASLGLNLSSVTLMSGHALSQRTSQRKLRRLLRGFALGAMAAMFLLISTIVLLRWQLADFKFYPVILVLLLVQALIMLVAKFTQPANTLNPWTVQSVRRFIQKRCIKTSSYVEALSLGIFSVLSGFVVLFLPLLNLASIYQPDQPIMLILILFSLATALPFLLICLVIARRLPISRVHRFLIANASFLQALTLVSLTLICWLTANLLAIGGLK